eukprot:4623154-Prymnesium_polylepis.1
MTTIGVRAGSPRRKRQTASRASAAESTSGNVDPSANLDSFQPGPFQPTCMWCRQPKPAEW